jgi:hypothetical protein
MLQCTPTQHKSKSKKIATKCFCVSNECITWNSSFVYKVNKTNLLERKGNIKMKLFTVLYDKYKPKWNIILFWDRIKIIIVTLAHTM